MRVLMVQTLSMEEAPPERVYPIGIVCLAGRLADGGHCVSILDMNMARDPFGSLKERLLDFQPDLVGLSLRNIDPLGNRSSSLIPPFIVATRMVAALAPHAWIVAGGTGFSLFPERILRELPEIDYGIVGEAEISFPELVSSLEAGRVTGRVEKRPRIGEGSDSGDQSYASGGWVAKEEPVSKNGSGSRDKSGSNGGRVARGEPGLAGGWVLRDGSGLKGGSSANDKVGMKSASDSIDESGVKERSGPGNESALQESSGKIWPAPSAPVDLGRYIPPARHLLDPSPYLDINSYVAPIGIETKRGCPYRCAYCVYPTLQGSGLRCRAPVSVVDEMESMHKEYSVSTFHFTDPVLNIPHGHLEAICREILRRKLQVRWSGFMREDHLDAKNIGLFEKAGCECFFFSADGLCQESLDVLQKGMREADILRAAALAAESDVISVYHFMVNVPGESEATVAKGMRLLDRIYDLHGPRRNLGTVVLNNIRILPGTVIEEIARKEGVIGPDTDLLYPVYYNPRPFDTLRYELQTRHLQQNVFMWHEVKG